ncbi:MAG: serine protease [bacterium]
MYQERKNFYRELEEKRQSKLLIYITGDRENRQTQISHDVIDLFVNHLDSIGDVDKLSLYLYTTGGITSAAWTLVNLIKQFCKEFELIVPRKAHSAGTLICLGADKIVMTKQATLGPIDPSVNTPLNPVGNTDIMQKNTVPVSVEDINAYLDGAKRHLGEKTDLTEIFSLLSEEVHPLVLGKTFRIRDQIRMLGKRLLSALDTDERTIDRILEFLCSESGSHDYTINRNEAKDLQLPIIKPHEDEYNIIKKIYDDISEELELTVPYNHQTILGSQKEKGYKLKLALLESLSGGSHSFISKGTLRKKTYQMKSGLQGTAIEEDTEYIRWERMEAGENEKQ